MNKTIINDKAFKEDDKNISQGKNFFEKLLKFFMTITINLYSIEQVS